MVQSRIFIFLSLIAVSQAHAHEKRVLISEEVVPLFLAKDAIRCYDAVDGPGFIGHSPGGVRIDEENIFDRTLRTKDVLALSVELPDLVTCAMIASELAQVPQSLSATKKVYRVIEKTYADDNLLKSSLVGEIELQLPVLLSGTNMVLTGNQRWVEEIPFTNAYMPRKYSYIVTTHPQSASYPVGLFCTPQYPWAEKYQLSLGQISSFYPDNRSNIDVIARTFNTEQDCEEIRTELMKRYEAEDPDNWGTFVRVDRLLELVYRHIVDNEGKPMCQEVQVETVSAVILGLKYMAVRSSFPVRTVNYKTCLETIISE